MSVTQAGKINGIPIPGGITKPQTYENGKALYGGLNDLRMGTCDQRERCKTCDCTFSGGGTGKMNDCPGHFGHIELASPMFHKGWFDTVRSSREGGHCVRR